MCGIVGFTSPGREAEAHARLLRMLDPIRHRGPDAEGMFVDAGVAFGHLRLAVVDLVGGRQPRVDPHTGDALVYNGEIYGYRALRDTLLRDGATLIDHSDTEVLFRLIQRYGVLDALERVDGMFAFAYREGATGALWLVRDRFGEKPLYYRVTSDRIAFASELAALRSAPDSGDDRIDPRAIRGYLDLEYLHGDRTLFAEIRKLLPGEALRFHGGTVVRHRYWTPRIERGDARLDENATIDRLEALLVAAVRDRLVANVPVGVFLSGGIDSSLVAAIAARQTPGIEAFTVGMSGAGYDETPYARAVAARYGMVHRVVPLDDEAIVAAFDSVTAKLDEPLADSSLLPSWVLCRAARQRVTVALSGDGADELFAGYANFAPNRFAKVLRHVSPTLGVWLRRALRIVPAGSGYMDLAFKLRQLSHGFGVPPPTQWSAWMSPFAHEDLRRLWRGPDLQADSFSALVKDSADEHWSTASLLEAFTTTYLPEDILAKVDRASMYNSLEVRAPYLDRAFAEAAMALPVGAKFRGLTGKRVLKKLAERFLPSDLIDRPKHGFAAPVADMLRGPLGASVRTTLFEGGTRLAAWFDRATIMRMWEEHAMRRVDHRKPIWTLFVLFRVVDRLGARI